MGRYLRLGSLLLLLLTGTASAHAEDEPLGIDDPEAVSKLISEAASVSRRFLNTIVSLGAKFSVADLTQPGADAPMTLVVLVLARAQLDERDFKWLGRGTPANLMRAAYPTDLRAGVSVPRHAYASFLHPEYLRNMTSEIRGKVATGTARFHAPGVYEGQVAFVAARTSTGWRITELRFVHSAVRTTLVDGRWKFSASEREPPSGRLGASLLTLPSVGTVGTLPRDAPVVVISLTREGYIRVPGLSTPLSLTALRQYLQTKTNAERLRADDGSSRVHALLDIDATTPWVAAQLLMMTCAHPSIQIHKIWLGAQTQNGQGGAVAAWLPRDMSIRGTPTLPPTYDLIKVRVFKTTQVAMPSDLRVFYAALKKRLALGGDPAKAHFEIIATPPKGGAVPHGFVLGALDACLAAGAQQIVFEGAGLPRLGDLGSSAESFRRYLDEVRKRPGVPVIRKRPGQQYYGAAGPDIRPIPAQGRLQRPWGVHATLGVMMEEPLEEIAEEDEAGPPGAIAGLTPLGKRQAAAVEAALRWLATHQSPDGMFQAADFNKWCDGKPRQGTEPQLTGGGKAAYDVGVTGLAIQAFLGAGYGHRGTHPYKSTVARGLRALKHVQDPEGCFGPRSTPHFIYNHAMAALAMVEAYGMTGSPIFKGSAQRALDFVALARNPYLAWRYGVKPGDNDTSVSGWMFRVVHTAQRINAAATRLGKPPPFQVDNSARDGMKAWLDRMTDRASGRVGYIGRGSGPARSKEDRKRFPADRSESLTAIGVLARIQMGADPLTSPSLKRGLALIAARPPMWNPASGDIDMYYWHWATLAMHRTGGKQNEAWRAALSRAVLGHQRSDGEVCEAKGSWDPIGPWGLDGGRVYSTALMALCLEAHDRDARLQPRKR